MRGRQRNENLIRELSIELSFSGTHCVSAELDLLAQIVNVKWQACLSPVCLPLIPNSVPNCLKSGNHGETDSVSLVLKVQRFHMICKKRAF